MTITLPVFMLYTSYLACLILILIWSFFYSLWYQKFWLLKNLLSKNWFFSNFYEINQILNPHNSLKCFSILLKLCPSMWFVILEFFLFFVSYWKINGLWNIKEKPNFAAAILDFGGHFEKFFVVHVIFQKGMP